MFITKLVNERSTFSAFWPDFSVLWRSFSAFLTRSASTFASLVMIFSIFFNSGEFETEAFIVGSGGSDGNQCGGYSRLLCGRESRGDTNSRRWCHHEKLPNSTTINWTPEIDCSRQNGLDDSNLDFHLARYRSVPTTVRAYIPFILAISPSSMNDSNLIRMSSAFQCLTRHG